jgi:hypothetical protein
MICLYCVTGAPRREDIDVTAHSPSGRAVLLQARHPPPSAPGTTASSATFEPDEAGTWTIAITYKGEHIQVMFLFNLENLPLHKQKAVVVQWSSYLT